MKPLTSVGVLLLAMAACAPAPAATVAGPSPAPSPTPAPAPAAPPTLALGEAPANWWQLDPTANRVRGISAVRGYQELLAGKQPRRSVVVAIIDSGIDITHPDLDGNLWVNEDEVAGNGRDDDQNGYVDDVHGWNFIGGAGGTHVDQDTYELTRLYAIYTRRFANVRADTLSAAARRDYDEYQKIRTELEGERRESEQLLGQVRQAATALEQVTSVLQRHLGGGEVTAARVSAITGAAPDVMEARALFLRLDANGITPKVIEETREYAEGRLQYGLNPDFNPRSIVGDRYEDTSERVYGNNDVDGPDPSHGTHVGGIVAAERGNNLGIDGIAPTAKLMVIRAVPDGDERDKDVANAIRYAADNGAHVINMSFGKAYSPQKSVVDEAVRYADSKGVLMVHAAGNEGSDLTVKPNFPTRFYANGGAATRWIEVGASSWKSADSLVAEFSNFNREQVDVFAPGVDIRSTVPGSEYEENSGTSMAAPVVTGLAALLMAYYPELNAEEIRKVILDSATKYSDERVLGPGDSGTVRFGDLSVTGGVVNAYAAIRLAEQMVAAKR